MSEKSHQPKGNPLPWSEIESALRHHSDPKHRHEGIESGVHYGVVKLDGTNLGIDVHGHIYGRHHPVTGDSHCGTSLKHLRTPETRDRILELRRLLANDCGSNPSTLDPCETFIVYGEFGNLRQTKYVRSAANREQWTCFGVKFRFPMGHSFGSALREMEMMSTLRERGHRFHRHNDNPVRPDEGRIAYTIVMTPRLGELLVRAGLRAAEILYTGPLEEWIERAADWLTGAGAGDKEEEGLVIVSPSGRQLKWKNPNEAQPSVSLSDLPSGLDHPVFRQMARVLVTRDERTTKTKKGNAVKESGLRSAMSKFNTDDWVREWDTIRQSSKPEHFDRDIRASLTGIQHRLAEELFRDREQLGLIRLQRTVDDDTIDMAMSQCLKEAGIKVGREYADWKRGHTGNALSQ